MHKATDIVVEDRGSPPMHSEDAHENAGTQKLNSRGEATNSIDDEGLHSHDEKKHHEQKVTPLPMQQLVPMTFVLLNESLCQTMLLPFVGYLISFLQNWPPDEAGYFSGFMVGVFAFGQIVSARVWGKLSDKYGRRFPLISGLFTSGIMMIGFGLSPNVWCCALFRFFHGLFNGNVLVTKTMMADITDKTNQAKGFAFVSFCSGIGFLIGPLLGGILYDPANPESALSFLHLSPNGIFARRPALLPSLFIFLYTNVGVTACTFFVQESNPNAQPLPSLLKALYPCMWVATKPFVRTPAAPEEFSDPAEGDDTGGDDSDRNGKHAANCDLHSGTMSSRRSDPHTPHNEAGGSVDNGPPDRDRFHPLHEESVTFPVGTLGIMSPIALEDTRRFDRLMEEHWAAQSASGSFPRSPLQGSPSAASSTRWCDGTRCGVVTRRPSRCTEEKTVDSPPSAAAASCGCGAGSAVVEMDPRLPVADLNDLAAQIYLRPGAGCANRCAEAESVEYGRTHPLGGNAVSTACLKKVVQEESPSPVASTEERDSLEKDTDEAKRERAVGDRDEGDHKEESFGYRQAFSRPITRFMLITYMILCASDMTVKQCFPLWAISSIEKGGLAFTPAQVSYILLFNSFPTLVSNYFFSLACNKYENKIALFRVGLTCSGTAAAFISMSSYIPVHFLQYFFVVLCTAGQQFFCSWCYGLITMLTARAAPPGKIGVLMGINQSCGAFSRAVIPVITGPIYAWSIRGNHPFPFNHVFVFCLSAMSFCYCWFRSHSVKTVNGTDLVLVEGNERYGPNPLRHAVLACKGKCCC